MLTWMMEYWVLCLIALLIGIVTGWWIWARASRPAFDVDATPTRVDTAPPRPPLEPVRPVVEPAKPVQFAAAEPIATAPPPPPPAPAAAAPVAPAPVAAAPVAAAPVAADTGGARPAIAAAVGAPDNLELLKGIGPKLASLLASLGVTRFDQIAAWTAREIAEVDGYLGSFKGRIERDNWVDQAGLLARGDKAAFEAKYGSLGSEL